MTGLMSLGHTRNLRNQTSESGPGDPALFASTVLDTAIAGKTEAALKLYDQGVATFGPGFTETYNAMRDQRDAADKQTIKPEPGVLSKVASWVGNNVKIGEGAVDTNTPDDTGYKMTLNGMPRTASRDSGLLSLGGFPSTKRGAAVDDNVPAASTDLPDELPYTKNPEWKATTVDMKRALSDPAYRESIIPTPDQPYVNPLPTTGAEMPIVRPDRHEVNTAAGQRFRGSAEEEAVARGVPLEQVEAERAADLAAARAADAPAVTSPAAAAAPTEPPAAPPAAAAPPAESGLPPAPDMTGGYGAGALSGLPAPAPAPTEPDPTFSFRTSQTGQTDGGLPRTIRPVVAPRNSGGLASMAGPAPSPAPAPAPAPGPAASGPPTPLTPPPAAAPAAPPPEAPAEEPAGDDKNRYWEALIQAGLGTMASQNSTFLGAIGEGGMQGVKQLGEIRKQMREEKRDASDAAYRKGSLANQREGIQVQREGIASTDRRAAEEIQARKDLQTQELANRNALLDKQLSNTIRLKGMEVQSQYDLLNARADIESQLLVRKEELERQGKQFQRQDAFEYLHSNPNGPQLPKESAGIMAAGFAPPKDTEKVRSPMGEKETAQAFDLAAGTILGEGYTGQQLLDQLPPQVKGEVLSEASKRDDPSGAAAAVIGVLKKNNIVPKDTSALGGLFGKEMTLTQTQPKAPPRLTYVPGKGAVPQ